MGKSRMFRQCLVCGTIVTLMVQFFLFMGETTRRSSTGDPLDDVRVRVDNPSVQKWVHETIHDASQSKAKNAVIQGGKLIRDLAKEGKKVVRAKIMNRASPDSTSPPPPTPLAPLPSRHPEFRVAVIVPWLGKTFPVWFMYFLRSIKQSAFIADWLIFHESATVPSEEMPDNVLFYDLGPSGLGIQFGVKLAQVTGQTHKTYSLTKRMQQAFADWPYIIVEYKPTLGSVFSEYITTYSHWAYADIDLMMGDLPLLITRDELENYDMFTYSFGDNIRMYLRGQFTAHKNNKAITTLWTGCHFLSDGLETELAYKARILKLLHARGDKKARTHFNSAEGCYSSLVANQTNMRVKFSTKALADFGEKEIYMVDGAIRKCPPGTIWNRNGTSLEQGSGGCNPLASPAGPHSLELPGTQVAVGPMETVARHKECARWVSSDYRVCANMTEEEQEGYNLFIINGTFYRQKYKSASPGGTHEGAFFHFQQWKGRFRALKYKQPGMEKVQGTRYRITKNGFFPI